MVKDKIYKFISAVGVISLAILIAIMLAAIPCYLGVVNCWQEINYGCSSFRYSQTPTSIVINVSIFVLLVMAFALLLYFSDNGGGREESKIN